jgi:hypothetical protein
LDRGGGGVGGADWHLDWIDLGDRARCPGGGECTRRLTCTLAASAAAALALCRVCSVSFIAFANSASRSCPPAAAAAAGEKQA